MTLDCPKCGMPLVPSHSGQAHEAYCEFCRDPREVYVLPAFFHTAPKAQSGERLLVDTEASCFYHPTKKAHTTCETCGRFICQLCHTEVNEQSICLNCLTSQPHNQNTQNFEKTCVMYDNIALHLCIIPLLIWPFTLVTAPTALFLVLKHWGKGPTGQLPRTRIRYVFAILLALLQIVGWTYWIFHWIY